MADKPIPFSRPLFVVDVGEQPIQLSIVAEPEERAATAKSLGLPAISAFAADFRIVTRAQGRILVEGELRASLTRICVITLDPFDVSLVEPIEIEFAAPQALAPTRTRHERAAGESIENQSDPPDPIIDGRIDLGTAATEFLALALDPYPRKPGASFCSGLTEETQDESPFAALSRLIRDGD